MSQRPTRYRAPSTGRPVPPRRPPASPPGRGGPPPTGAGHHELLDPDGKPGRRGRGPRIPTWQKAAGAFVVLAVLFYAYSKLTADNAPQIARTPPKAAPAPAPAAKKPSRWQQTYETALRYDGHVLNIRRVYADQLNKPSARVRYRMTIIPSPDINPSWITDKRRYNLTVPNHHLPARSIDVTRDGRKRKLTVTFRWPTKLLHEGSKLQLQLPVQPTSGNPTAKPDVIYLAVEIPLSNTGVVERFGAGGVR